jgi:putative membrane protein
MFEPKRLHPITIVIITGKRIKSLLFPLIALIAFGGRWVDGNLVSFLASLVAIIVIFLTSLFSWFRYTYRMENAELRIEYGLFIRKKRYIPLERIQSLDISEGLLGRVFGLVKVQIETAGGSGSDEAEAVLTAISKQEAEVIQEYVTSAKNADQKALENVQERPPIYKITLTQLVLLSVTSGGVGVVLSAVLAFLSQFDNFIPYKKLFGGIEKWAVSNIIIIALLVFSGFLLAWVVALIGTMLKYANFTVTKTDRDLIIFKGLLERRQITIPLKRIQAIRINENLIRQFLGYATVYVESAGGSTANKEGSKVMLLPIVKKNQIGQILEPYLTDYVITKSFVPAPKRALRRYLFRSWYFIVPITVISLIFLKAWGLFSLLLLAAGSLWSILKYKDAGWSLDQQQLSLRSRTIIRTTVFMKKNKIQSVNMRESYFQQKGKLGSIEAFVKSGLGPSGGEVIDLEKNDIQAIYRWYSGEK